MFHSRHVVAVRQQLLKPITSAVFVCALLAAGRSYGVVIESFESPQPSWKLAEADCAANVVAHARSFDASHSGRGSEHLQLRTGQGTHVHFAHRVSPARIINELQPSVWVKADRPGIQILARLVLPRSRHARTGEPLTALLAGESYDRVGNWQQLFVSDVEALTRRQVFLLRQSGHQVDTAEAYIDLVVLNAYAGPGATSLWIDDLAMSGYATTSVEPAAEATHLDAPPITEPPQPATRSAGRVRAEGNVVLADGQAIFARIIEHNGESLAWLHSLGFNAVALRAPPSEAISEEADRVGLWLVAPPPVGDELIQRVGRPVLAWRPSPDVNPQRAEHLRRQGTPLLWTDASLGRSPIDLVVRGRTVLGTSYPLNRYEVDLRREAEREGGAAAYLAAIDTGMPASLTQQVVALTGHRAVLSADPDQLRVLAIHAALSGARGIYFRSNGRLDQQDEPTQLRAATLRLVNIELSAIEPWLAGGRVAGDLPSDDPTARVRAVETDRARLLVVTRGIVDDQYSLSPLVRRPITFTVSATSISDQAYRLTSQGLRPLKQGAGGEVTISDQGRLSFVLATQDGLAISRVGRALAESRTATIDAYRTIAELYLRETQRVTNAAASHQQSRANDTALIQQARALVDQGIQRLVAGDGRYGLRAIEEGIALARRVRHDYWMHAQRSFPSPASSPLCASFSTLPSHWDLARRVQGTQWSENLLPGGDFEDLRDTMNSGWRVERPTGENRSLVEISPHDPAAGRMSLHIRGDPHSTTRVFSAEVPVLTHQVMRIHGWVKFEPGADGSGTLRIYDSMTGDDLAERIERAAPWRQFTLYRGATSRITVRAVFEVQGDGDVWVDGVSISTLMGKPPALRRQAASEAPVRQQPLR